MRILFYSHFFAPSIGGVETIVLSLARGIAELHGLSGFPDFELTLITQTAAGDFDDRNLEFRVVRQPNLRRLVREIRSADIVHVAGPALLPLILGWLTGVPFVVEHHGFQTICPTGQLLIEPGNVPCPGHFMAGRHLECLRCRSEKNWKASGKLWLLTFVRRFLCARAAANIAPTEWLRGLIHIRNSISVPHGLEASRSQIERVAPANVPMILFLGRLVTTKGLPVLLEAARILRSNRREFEVVVVGDGPERSALQDSTEKLELSSSVRFMGRLAEADLSSVVTRASMIVVPSLGGEVFGLVVAENMLRGVPVIASDLGCFAEVLDGAGLTFPVGDAKALAIQIARLLDDPGLPTSLGALARARILSNYRRDQMIEGHARLYRNISGITQL